MEIIVSDPLTTRGWRPAQRLFSPNQAAELGRIGRDLQPRLSRPQDFGHRTPPDFETRPWFKNLHAVSPEFFDLGTDPGILVQVKQALGENVLLWGTALIERHPGQVHRWHVDLEHRVWPGVSVFVALEGVKPGLSGLKFIGGSQRLDQVPRGDADHEVLRQAQAMDSSCSLDHPPITDGEFLVFAGKVWHGSANLAGQARLAALLQYTTPASSVAAPLTWDPPIVWNAGKPPCVLVSGEDRYGRNRLVGRPPGNLAG